MGILEDLVLSQNQGLNTPELPRPVNPLWQILASAGAPTAARELTRQTSQFHDANQRVFDYNQAMEDEKRRLSSMLELRKLQDSEATNAVARQFHQQQIDNSRKESAGEQGLLDQLDPNAQRLVRARSVISKLPEELQGAIFNKLGIPFTSKLDDSLALLKEKHELEAPLTNAQIDSLYNRASNESRALDTRADHEKQVKAYQDEILKIRKEAASNKLYKDLQIVNEVMQNTIDPVRKAEVGRLLDVLRNQLLGMLQQENNLGPAVNRRESPEVVSPKIKITRTDE